MPIPYLNTSGSQRCGISTNVTGKGTENECIALVTIAVAERCSVSRITVVLEYITADKHIASAEIAFDERSSAADFP